MGKWNTPYAYDSLSRLLSVLHETGVTGGGTTTVDGAAYTYDNAGNRSSKTNLMSNVTENYGYDAIYQLTQVTASGQTTEAYGYDAVGNRISAAVDSGWTYDASNHLTARPGISYAYDNNGNLLEMGEMGKWGTA
jgi:YD repeat-containing protein